MNVQLVNENSIIVYFSDTVTIDTAAEVAHACRLLRSGLADCLCDIVPSYTSILISCDLVKIDLRAFLNRVKELLEQGDIVSTLQGKSNRIVLPVYYGEEVALDHAEITQQTGLSFSEVVEVHTSERYRVFAIGFLPGFAYLGNTHSKIRIPRKKSPRASVPKGSVAIADQQTAVYPRESPGGWQIIGKTPVELFDTKKSTLSLFEIGDEVQFESIDRKTFLEMGGEL